MARALIAQSGRQEKENSDPTYGSRVEPFEAGFGATIVTA